jgi:large subunit ribosomal protein L25
MELQSLKVDVRQSSGKGPARQARREGAVPGVLYGGGEEPVSLKVDLPALRRLIQDGGEHAVVQLDVQANATLSTPALVRSVQRHPVNGKIVHADFFRIRLDTKITTVVPITLVGQARGVVDGGVIDPQMREVEVECLALEVPHEIRADVSDLGIGDSIHVSDLVAPANVTIITEGDRPIVTVHAPRVLKEGTSADGETTTAAPEVIGEKKKDEKADDKKK